MEEKNKMDFHKIILTDQSKGLVTGVKDMDSFDDKEILLMTEYGKLVIKGEQLHVSRLDLGKGEVELDGTVESFEYVKKGTGQKKKNFMKRIFQ